MRRDLPPALLENLRDLARRQGASLAAVGLAMVSAMLYRLTRQPDMVIGMGVAGRDSADTEGLIGFFVNVLPIRIQLDDDTEAGQLIDQINQRLMAALDRRDVPFDMVVRAVAPQRAGARQPLANVIFEYQRFGDMTGGGEVGGTDAGLPPPPDDGGILGDAVAGLIDATTAKHDLIVFFEDEGARARFSFEYDTGRFAASTIDLWMGFLIRITTALSARSNET
ncbi:condensation domain-containing protein [Tistrella bauzanensis]